MKFPPHIKLGVLPTEYIIELNETVKDNIFFVGGVESKLMQMLSKYLNFKYTLFTPADREWGVFKPDGTWSGLVGMVNRSEVDMAMSFMTITLARGQAVNFVPYHTEATTFATSLPREVANTYFYLEPFENNLWIPCLLAILLMSLLYYLLQDKASYFEVFFTMLGSFTKQSATWRGHLTKKQRYILGSWYIFTNFIALAFSAVLLSYMMAPSLIRGVETIKELALAVSKGKYKCYSMKGSADHEFMLKSSDPSLLYIGRMVQENGWFINGEIVPKEIEWNTAVTGLKSLMELKQKSDLERNIFVFTENIATWRAGIAVRKDFCCIRKLEETLKRMRCAGIYQKLYSEEIHNTMLRTYKSYVYKHDGTVFDIRHTSGIFHLLLGGYLVSVLCLSCEIVVGKVDFVRNLRKNRYFAKKVIILRKYNKMIWRYFLHEKR